jgi:hypothetical protein
MRILRILLEELAATLISSGSTASVVAVALLDDTPLGFARSGVWCLTLGR